MLHTVAPDCWRLSLRRWPTRCPHIWQSSCSVPDWGWSSACCTQLHPTAGGSHSDGGQQGALTSGRAAVQCLTGAGAVHAAHSCTQLLAALTQTVAQKVPSRLAEQLTGA